MQKRLYKELKYLAKPYYNLLIIAISMLVLIVLIEISIAFSINGMIREALEKKDGNILIHFSLFLLLTITIGTCLKYFVKSFNDKFSTLFIHDLKNSLIDKIQKQSLEHLEKYNSGDISSIFTINISQIEIFLKRDYIDLIYQPVVFLLSSIIFLSINWRLFLVSVIVIPLFLKIANVMTSSLKNSSGNLQKHFGRMNAVLTETIHGSNIIKSFNQQELQFNKFNFEATKALDESLKMEKRLSFLPPLQLVLQAVPYGLCILYGGFMSVNQEISPSELLTCIYLMQFLVGPAVRIPSLIGSIQMITASFSRIDEIVSAPFENNSNSDLRDSMSNNCIEFNNVTYRYSNKAILFKNLSFVVKKNQTVAIVGESGSGKSTILKLICGLYKIESGEIKILGNNISEVNLSEIRNLISVVPQDSYLFPDTIKKNINYGRLNATFEEIICAAQFANAHDFIMDLPENYQTKINENASSLSGGQRQRINIARALLKNAPILLLDEPTSALDNKSEALIQEALEKLFRNRTVLVVAHRLSTIINADEILVMGDSGILDRGTHNQLMNNSEYYRKLYKNQFGFSTLKENMR
ncbi:ABC transporter ATP-binding protein [Paenibacillus beijingensis]|uniref:ABC transporter ATP-binding protein n=1 Tax=Paenibacillus beijingensis TaxID=1126833 RepID=A0A0D5NMQ7_9BACL|nr:ABC transporter ATP-binding protein [Paenibacillus beijingensis]AJY76272.1 hypothetical protein VN24_19035 [Paenibacillus beijingensis]